MKFSRRTTSAVTTEPIQPVYSSELIAFLSEQQNSEDIYVENSHSYSNLLENSSNTSQESNESQNPFFLYWWIQLTFGVLFFIIALIAILGNGLIIWIILGHRVMRTSTNCFLLNLAIADLCNAGLNFPFVVIYMLNHYDWIFGTFYCKFQQFLGNCILSCIVFTLMTMAFER